MKHTFTTLLIAGGLAIGATAQNPNLTGGPAHTRTVTFKDKNAVVAKYANTNRSQSLWLNYALAADSLYGGIASLGANYLFPDSTVLGEFGVGTFDWVWIHSIAQSLDPTAYYHNYFSGMSMTDADAYTIDSMGVYYIYERNIQNNNIVDTLVIKLTNNATTTNYQANGFIGTTAANYGTDTVGFRLPKYDNVSNTANGTANTQMFKIPLDINDTSVTFVGYKAFAVPTPFMVNPSRIAGVSISFKPGYTYALGDTLETELNNFLFTSYEEQGTNTFMIYNDCNYLAASCDYNMSGIVRTAERFAYSGNSWNTNYIPTLAFTQGYSLEHHLIDWKVTSTTSIKENELGVALGQNIPNPATGTTMINYELSNAGKVSFEVYDIAGKQVFFSNEGNKPSGKHSFQLNVDGYNAGVYFYTLTVDGVRVTKKMTITE